jgi:hypothetical protein
MAIISTVIQKSEYDIYCRTADETESSVTIVAKSGDEYTTSTGYSYVLDETVIAVTINSTNFSKFWKRYKELQERQPSTPVETSTPSVPAQVTSPHAYPQWCQHWVMAAVLDGWVPIPGPLETSTHIELMSFTNQFFVTVDWGSNPGIAVWNNSNSDVREVTFPYSMDAIAQLFGVELWRQEPE